MSHSISDGIIAGSWIMEQLTLQLPDVEMAAGRRAWHEARSAWPGDERRLWWKWLTEAAQSIGLQTKTVDCTVAEAVELVKGGTRVIAYRDGEPPVWLSVRLISNSRVELNRATNVSESRMVHRRSLRKVFREFEHEGRVRCVVVRTDIGVTGDESRRLKPLARLLAILKPEWPDIWIVLVFAFIVGLLMLATPIAVEALVNTVAFGRFLQPVIVLALILLIFLAFSAALRALQTYVTELVQRRLFARVAGDLAFRLPRTRADVTDGIYMPELTNRFFDIVTVQKVAAQLLLDGLGLVLTAVIGMAVLAFYHPWLLGFDIVMMATIAFIIFVLGRGAVASAVKESKHKYYMASWLEDIARCPTTFRTSGGTDLALERADRLVHEYLEARQKHFRILMRQIIFALGLQAVASTALLGIGGWLVITGELTLGQLVAAELIVTVIVGAFAKIGKHMESFYDLLASVDKLGALLDLTTERQDGILELNGEGPAVVHAYGLRYTRSPAGHLTESTTFRLPAGDSLAILGCAGCGKSTLLELIYGLRAPTEGHVTIDEFDPMDIRADVLRDQVALVRSTEIFHGTLEENVHLNRSNVTSADVRRALEQVGLYETVLRLPDGYSTHLDGNGHPLAGSARDLLCLARAIAGRPRLLLIDGLLDGLSDDELQHALDCLQSKERPWTMIVATGRQSIASRLDHGISLLRARPADETAEKGASV